jgi:hypothetical protein
MMDQALPEGTMDEADVVDRTAPHPGVRNAASGRQAAETRRLYAADWADFVTWSSPRQHDVLPADPETVATYLRALSLTLRAGALARRAAAIADRHRRENLPSPAQDERVRHVLRAARDAKRASLATPPAGRARRPALPGPALLLRMAARCPGDLAGLRDRALLLLTAAGLSGEGLLALDREHVQFTAHAVVLAPHGVDAQSRKALLPSSSEADGPAPWAPGDDATLPAEPEPQYEAPFVIGRLAVAASCPVRALERWLEHSDTQFGPVFRKVNRWGGIEHARLQPDGLRRIRQRRADALRPTPAARPSGSRGEEAT